MPTALQQLSFPPLLTLYISCRMLEVKTKFGLYGGITIPAHKDSSSWSTALTGIVSTKPDKNSIVSLTTEKWETPLFSSLQTSKIYQMVSVLNWPFYVALSPADTPAQQHLNSIMYHSQKNTGTELSESPMPQHFTVVYDHVLPLLFCSNEASRNTGKAGADADTRSQLVRAAIVCHNGGWSVRGFNMVNVQCQVLIPAED